jgi:biotin carboxyl carrier protein
VRASAAWLCHAERGGPGGASGSEPPPVIMLRRFSVTIGGKERIVELDGGRVVVDGVEREIELLAVEEGAWLLREGNGQALAYVDGERGKIGVSIRRGGADPVVVAAEVMEARSAAVAELVRARATAVAGPAAVRSPMPGRVVKMRAGERIAAGHAVVVVEAMKMENELRAPRAGTILEIRCAEGEAVEAGQDLIVVETTPG